MSTLSVMIVASVAGAVSITLLLTFFVILWGGIEYIVSKGDTEVVMRAKKRITYAVIGGLITLFIVPFWEFLGKLFGFNF